jgi:hypothetical protein
MDIRRLKMNTQQILSMFMYPKPSDNIRTKSFPIYHNLTIAAGTLSYSAFTPDIAYAVSNLKLPLSGQQMYTVTGMKLRFPSLVSVHLADLASIVCNSYVSIYINSRLQVKLPVGEMINFPNELIVNSAQTISMLSQEVSRRFADKEGKGFPFFFNSNSNVQIVLEMPSAVATALDTLVLTLDLDGWLADKLVTFNFDDLQGQQFQILKDSIWQQTTYQSGSAGVDILQSAPTQYVGNNYFPLSDINNFQIENIECIIVTDQPYNYVENALRSSFITMMVNDVNIFESNLLTLTSIIQNGSGNFTDSNADTTAYTYQTAKRKSLILENPILIPPVAKVITQLTFATAANIDTNKFLVDLKGTGQRRVT